jgi:hypothetical protein
MSKKIIEKAPPKKADKKPAAKKPVKKNKGEEDDFNDPVWIDPNKQAEDALANEKRKPEVTKAEKEFNVEVTSAKLKDIFLSASWKNMSPQDKGSYDRDGENPVHDDLKKAFSGLNKHLAAMSEQYNNDGDLDSDKIVCRGFSIGGNGEGVTLHGTRLLSNGKPFNFNTPFYKWDSDPSETLFNEESNSLKSAINTLRAEIIQYLFKHKYQAEIAS